jgi:hypothetical protein
MYCMLADYFHDTSFKSLNLEVLAHKWMDSSYEVREAAQSLLKCELKRIGPNGRSTLIKLWEPHLNSLLKECEDFSNTSHVALNANANMSLSNIQLNSTQSINFSNNSSLVNFTNSENSSQSHMASKQIASDTNKTVYNESTGRLKHKQYIAIIILSVIGAEFGQDVSTSKIQASNHAIPQGFSIEDHTILKRISNNRFAVVLSECLFIMS